MMEGGHDPAALGTLLKRLAGAGQDLALRPMFGGFMTYVRGKPFAFVSRAGISLKLADEDRVTLLATPGARPLQRPSDTRSSRNYTFVPDEWLAEEPCLTDWVARSLRFVNA